MAVTGQIKQEMVLSVTGDLKMSPHRRLENAVLFP
jgi:hypothetical protein